MTKFLNIPLEDNEKEFLAKVKNKKKRNWTDFILESAICLEQKEKENKK